MSASIGTAGLWQDILKGIKYRATDPLQFSRVFIGGILHESKIPIDVEKRLRPREKKPVKVSVHYYLGEEFPNIYLTGREADCMVLLLHYYTNEEVAEKLNLSTRTIEFYVKNMRQKLNCHSKIQLVDRIQRTEFMKFVDEIRARLKK
jgi:DNA-binding NarL/FixJ family response regulator